MFGKKLIVLIIEYIFLVFGIKIDVVGLYLFVKLNCLFWNNIFIKVLVGIFWFIVFLVLNVDVLIRLFLLLWYLLVFL